MLADAQAKQTEFVIMLSDTCHWQTGSARGRFVFWFDD
jgi:hypothetical protein